jgi:hypothetical protein
MFKKIKRLFDDFIIAYRLNNDINHYQKLSPRKEKEIDWHNTRRQLIINSGKRHSKNGLIRNMLASYFKQSRKLYPYTINQDWVDNKKIYMDYYQMSNHIKSIDELKEKLNNNETIYITKFSNTSIYKGELFNQYGCVQTMSNTNNETYILDYSNLPYDDYRKTNIRYSTDDEIQNYNKIQKEIDSLQLIVDQKEDELWDLRQKIQELYKQR